MMDMDEDIEEFVEEDDFMEAGEVDWEYEFDAAQYFDFSRPETPADSQEAERWFSNAGNYPASQALIVKLKLGGGMKAGKHKTASAACCLDGNTSSSSIDMSSQGSSPSKGSEGVKETKTKSFRGSSKQWSSTLMKPTVSHLAKLKNGGDNNIVLPNLLCERFQKSPTHADERSLQNVFDNLSIKRQKLEIGYLLKGSRMRHQAWLLHKKSQKDANTTPNAAHPKLKVTVPKEPALETLQRAINRRSRTNSESSERSELETQISKAPSTNRKILKPPSPTPTIKSKQKLTEFQAFNFKTTARALQRSNSELNRHDSESDSADLKRSNIDDDALKEEKNERLLKAKAGTYSNKIYPTKEDTSSGVKNTNKETTVEESKLQKERLSQNPPTELFKQLSLKSELGSDTVSRPKSRLSAKGSKENAPDSFQPDFWRCVGKMCQCGSEKAIPGIAHQPNANRCLDIR